jgi:anti-sigma28 factor (negative regulator of flagellin synthesis)
MKQSYKDFKRQASEGGKEFAQTVAKLEREAMQMTWEERCERIEQIKARIRRGFARRV